MADDNVYNIQWFPGHMAKTRRMIAESLHSVDAVIELLDARIPFSSANPDIRSVCAGKRRLTVLNKCDLSDKKTLELWKEYISSDGTYCVAADSTSGTGMNDVVSGLRRMLADKTERLKEKSYSKNIRAMVLGIPNVGKSTFINRLAGAVKAKAENRPGVTRDRQWVRTSYGIDLLDTPGVLWPRFDDRTVAENLAVTGAIRDDILDQESLAVVLVGRLLASAPSLLAARYRLLPEDTEDTTPYEVFLTIAKKRGMIRRGGEPDTERAAAVLLDEFRSGKIGRITLELPQNTR